MKNMKKALAIVLATLLCVPTTLSTVYGAEVNGTYEAEDAKIEGTYQSMDWTTFQPIDVNPVEENAKASGGKNVGFFSTVGNSITWTVNADEAGAADLTFVLASCVNEYSADYTSATHKELPLKDHLSITVNGQELDVTGKVVAADKNATQATYDYYQDVVFENVALIAGANTITIKVTGLGTNPMVQESANVDCLKVSGYTAGASGDNGGNGNGEAATGSNNLRIEAENAEYVVDLSGMQMWMPDLTSPIEVRDTASGGASIGYFGATGNKVTWKFDASAAGKATIVLGLASGATDMTTFGQGEMVLEGNVKILANGTELNVSGIKLEGGDAEYDNWKDVTFEIDVVAGANEVVLEVISTTGPNVDYMDVKSDSISFTSSQTGGGSNGGGSNGGGSGSGTIKIEAENADIVADLSGMSWMGVTSVVETRDTASGGASIGYFGAVGNKVTWKFDASAAGKVTLKFALASGTADQTTFQQAEMMLEGNVKLLVNGTELNVSGIKLEGGDAEYDNWKEIVFEADVVAGANEVVLEVTSTSGPNVDYLEVSSDAVTFTTSQTGEGNTPGGNTPGGNTPGGNTPGGNTPGGNTPGGNTPGGNTPGGNTPGGNTPGEDDSNDDKPNEGDNNQKPVQQTGSKDAISMLVGGIIGAVVTCVLALGIAAVAHSMVIARLPEEDKKALKDSIDAAKARKEEWKKEYATINDAYEKEISRVKFDLNEKAITDGRIAEIEEMKYGAGARAMKVLRLVDIGTSKAKYILLIIIAAVIIGGLIGAF